MPNGFSNDVMFAKNADFTRDPLGSVSENNGLVLNGELWIGRTIPDGNGAHINVGNVTSSTLTVGYSAPNITVNTNGGGAPIEKIALQTGTTPIAPTAGLITFNGAVVAAGTNPVRTDGTGASTMALQVQTSQAIASTDATKVGLANFSSNQFNVDANGYVNLKGSSTLSAVQSLTGDNGLTVLPDSNGNINIHGLVVANSTNAKAVYVSSSSNTEIIDVQVSAAIVSTDITKVGLSAFDSAAFDVDANGFVQLNGGGIAATAFDVQANTAPGTDPVVPSATGVVIVNGAAVANHSVVLESRSRAANAYNLEVQYAAAAAATDATKSGVAHFNSAQFSVDANGFVSSTTGFSPNSIVSVFDDFIGTGTTLAGTTLICQTPYQNQNFLNYGVIDNAHPGVVRSATGGNTYTLLVGTDAAGSGTGKNIILGGGALILNWVINIGTLSAATPRYIFRVGLGDSAPGDQANGCYVEYSDNVNSGNWTYKTAAASSRTTSNSSVAVTTGWHNIQVSVNAAGTSVSFSVDGVSLGAAITTNIPSLGISPFINANYTAGVGVADTFVADLWYMTQTLTTPR